MIDCCATCYDVTRIPFGCAAQQALCDPFLPAWLPTLRCVIFTSASTSLTFRFRREGEETAFQVIKGDPKLVERCDVAAKAEEWRTGCYLTRRLNGRQPQLQAQRELSSSADSYLP